MKSKNFSLEDIIDEAEMIADEIAFEILDKAEVKDSILAFGRYYLPHYFSDKQGNPVASPAFHGEICEVLEDDSLGKRAVWEAPRGHAKSTLISLCYPLWLICEKKKRYIVLVSDTATQAQMFLGFITRELEENEKLKADYGDDLLPMRDQKNAYVSWTDSDIITKAGIKVSARGMLGAVRGLREKEYRPDLIVVDDPENDELVMTADRRRKNWNWFNDSLMNTLDRDGDAVALGTRIHHDCLISRLMRDPEQKKTWTGKSYKAINLDSQGKEYALWENYWSLERLAKRKDEIKSVSFEKEFQNNPINPEDQLFKEDWFKFYSLKDVEDLTLLTAGFLDPSLGKSKQSDYSATIIVGRADNGNLYVLYANIERITIQNIALRVNSICRQFPQIVKFGVESNAFQAVIKTLIDEQSKKEKLYIPTVEVKQITDKIMRIGRLSPLMEQGLIYLCLEPEAGNQHLLFEQLQQFPKGAHDDAPDALEGAISLLRDSSRPRFTLL